MEKTLKLIHDVPDDPNSLVRLVSGTIKIKNREDEVLYGRRRLTLEEAQRDAIKGLTKHDQSMMFGGVRMHTKTNALYLGLTQVGKTSAMKLSIAEVLKRIKEGSSEKVIIFDASNEFVPFIYAHAGEDVPVYILNPADSRCYQWDMAKDVEGQANTTDLSHTIVKDKENDTPFFAEGARCLVAGVMDAFYLTVTREGRPLDWTLRDVACATSSARRVKRVLDLQPEFLSYIEEAFLDRSNNDVFSTLIARTKELRVIAAMWHNRPKFSLKEFLDSKKGGVLILGADSTNRATMLELNRLIVERAGKFIANREECDEAKYWFFLDEFQLLGKSEIIKQLVKDGLKRGIRIHIACQNKADVVGTYGKEDASVIFSECAAQYIFKQGDEDSAEAARKGVGKNQIRRLLKAQGITVSQQEGETGQWSKNHSEANAEGTNVNGGIMPNITKTNNKTVTNGTAETRGKSKTTSITINETLTESILEEPAVLTGALQNYGIGEFTCVAPTIQGFWNHRFTWSEIEPIVRRYSENPDHARFIKRDRTTLYDYLIDWTDDDLKRLGLPEDTIAKKEKKRKDKVSKSKDEGQSIIQTINSRFN